MRICMIDYKSYDICVKVLSPFMFLTCNVLLSGGERRDVMHLSSRA